MYLIPKNDCDCLKGDVKLLEVIYTNLEKRGDGKTDPYRRVGQYWCVHGNLLAENDIGETRSETKNKTK